MKNLKIPDTIVLILMVLTVFAALTWVIPGGRYETEIQNGKKVVVPGSYAPVESNPAGFGDLMMAPFNGMTDASANMIIVFIFIVAGTFALIEATGATTALIQRTARFFTNNPTYEPLFIPVFMSLFAIMGSTFGLSEEVIVFIPLFVSLARALGYDTIVGTAVPFLGAGVGFAGAVLNPFTVGIAQGLAELPLMSGSGLRIAVLCALTIAAIVMVQRYAHKVKKTPDISPLKSLDYEVEATKLEQIPFTFRRSLIIATFFAGMVLLIVGVVQWGWYIPELSGLFFALGILAAVISGLDGRVSVKAFLDGMRSVMGAAVVVGLSKATLLLLTNAQVIDTILFHLAKTISGWPVVVSAYLMLAVQTLINTFVPSSSGQAALTIPIMAPLGDLVGITRQTVVLIFQFGDGLTNMIIPTSGVTMGVLGMARIPWEIWAGWVWRKILVFFAVASVFVAIAVLTGYA